ncbi:hypothetical protein JCM10212_002410 [Sporobolomyces blumeae]
MSIPRSDDLLPSSLSYFDQPPVDHPSDPNAFAFAPPAAVGTAPSVPSSSTSFAPPAGRPVIPRHSHFLAAARPDSASTSSLSRDWSGFPGPVADEEGDKGALPGSSTDLEPPFHEYGRASALDQGDHRFDRGHVAIDYGPSDEGASAATAFDESQDWFPSGPSSTAFARHHPPAIDYGAYRSPGAISSTQDDSSQIGDEFAFSLDHSPTIIPADYGGRPNLSPVSEYQDSTSVDGWWGTPPPLPARRDSYGFDVRSSSSAGRYGPLSSFATVQPGVVDPGPLAFRHASASPSSSFPSFGALSLQTQAASAPAAFSAHFASNRSGFHSSVSTLASPREVEHAAIDDDPFERSVSPRSARFASPFSGPSQQSHPRPSISPDAHLDPPAFALPPPRSTFADLPPLPLPLPNPYTQILSSPTSVSSPPYATSPRHPDGASSSTSHAKKRRASSSSSSSSTTAQRYRASTSPIGTLPSSSGGGSRSRGDPRPISPITGKPTKVIAKRGWPPKDAAKRVYFCSVLGCGKSFGRPSALNTHMRSHDGAKPFNCPVPACSRPFSVFSNLKRHMVVHPSVDFRSVTVNDLPQIVWVDDEQDPGGEGGRLEWIDQLDAAAGKARGTNSTSRAESDGESRQGASEDEDD